MRDNGSFQTSDKDYITFNVNGITTNGLIMGNFGLGLL